MFNDDDFKSMCVFNGFKTAEVVAAAAVICGIPTPWGVAYILHREKGSVHCCNCGAPMSVERVVDMGSCENCETMPLSAASALLRAGYEKEIERKESDHISGKRSLREAGTLISLVEAKDGDSFKETKLKVILITEGLGNLMDMNYYGPEAIQSAPAAFEGKPCFINHASYADERDRPEGDVRVQCGYYKNLKAEQIETSSGSKWACVGELHLDNSAAGKEALEKARMAIHYATEEFPDTGKDYVGLSVNAWGDGEPREMLIDGANMEVNYVERFVAARSCDIVTVAGRGGRILALVESSSGAGSKTKEVRKMLTKKLEEARKAMDLALAEKDESVRNTKINEASKIIEALVKDLQKLSAAVPSPRKEADSDTKGKDKDKEKDDEEKGKGKESDANKANESDKIVAAYAISALVRESGLPEKLFNMGELKAMPFVEAKKEVERMKRVAEHTAAIMLESAGGDATNTAKIFERGSSSASNDDAFKL